MSCEVVAPFFARPACAVTEQAQARLHQSSHPAVRRISCACENGVLVLHGKLATYFHKQVAQETVADLEGVRLIQNQIEVVYPTGCPARAALP
jgi:osmotically-inducible protein OsmY